MVKQLIYMSEPFGFDEPILAGILGVTGGVAVALATQQDIASSGPATFADPLGVGVPLVNLQCDPNQAILVVGRGDGRAALDTGIANNRDQARYLETASSCKTQLEGENAQSEPEYVAYTGPYPDLQTPCEQRMTFKHRTDYVARLKAGDTQLVKCPCVLPSLAAPQLSLQTKPAADSVVWVRSLQAMLNDDNPKAFPHSQINGIYDEFTRRYILTQFQTKAGYLGRGGVMDSDTWGLVTGQICPRYTY